MKIKIVVSLYWVMLSVLPNQGFSQGIILRIGRSCQKKTKILS